MVLVLLATTVALGATQAAHAAGPAKLVDCWKIVQYDAALGKNTALLSDIGMYAEHPQVGCNFLYLGDKVYAYNSEVKRILTSNSEQWDKIVTTQFTPVQAVVGEFSQLKYGKGESGRFLGMPCTRYFLKPGISPKPAQIAKTKTKKNNDRPRRKMQAEVGEEEVWLSDVIHLKNPNMVRCLSKYYSIPATDRYPLRIVFHRAGGKRIALNTLKIERTKAPADRFTPPKNYLRVKSLLEVTTGSGVDELIGDILPNLGLSEGASGSSKKDSSDKHK